MDNVGEGTYDRVIDAEHDKHRQQGRQTSAEGRSSLFCIELLYLFIVLLLVIAVLFFQLALLSLHPRVRSHTFLLLDGGGEHQQSGQNRKEDDGDAEILENIEQRP